jgi:membrane dipeptidase
LAAKGGVIHINFGSSFLVDDLRKKTDAAAKEMSAYLKEHNLEPSDPAAKRYREEHAVGYADVTDVVAHIDHVVTLAGEDHVGFGSDFDGLGDSLPKGLKDVSYYPNLLYELMKKGYSDDSLRKICSGNLLRVWDDVERVARESEE